jgi:TatD DNase family protein
MQYYIDTHCHLDLFDQIANNPARENEFPIKTVSVTNAPVFFEPNVKLFQGLDNIRISLGLHPQLASKFSGQIGEFNEKLRLTKYIGEIGLDGSRDIEGTWQLQKTVLDDLLSNIRNAGPKMLTIHSRHAANETIDIIHKYLFKTNCAVVLHWFTGNISELTKAEKLGFYFSVNHKMVSAVGGKQLIAKIPLGRLLTETDAPFTFDERIRTRMESLQTTIKGIAQIRKMDEIEVVNAIFENFKTILVALK